MILQFPFKSEKIIFCSNVFNLWGTVIMYLSNICELIFLKMYHELLWYVKLFVKVWFFYFYFLNSLSFNFWRKIIMRTNCFQNFENCKKFSMSQLLSYLYIQKILFYIFLDVTFSLESFLTDYFISTMEPPWTYYLFFCQNFYMIRLLKTTLSINFLYNWNRAESEW